MKNTKSIAEYMVTVSQDTAGTIPKPSDIKEYITHSDNMANKTVTVNSFGVWEIERDWIPVGCVSVTGCFTGTINTNYGQSQNGGGNNTFTVPYGYSITFYFTIPTPFPVGVDHYVLTTENGNMITLPPNNYTINNVTEPGMVIHLKCVDEDGNIIF